MTDPLIDAVAIILHDTHQPNYKGTFYDEEYSDEKDREFYRRLSRAAVLAVLDGIREPSEGMLAAGLCAAYDHLDNEIVGGIWEDMLDAKMKEING